MSKNLLAFVAGGSDIGEFVDYYRPDNFGEFSKNNSGVRAVTKDQVKSYTFDKDTYFKKGNLDVNKSRNSLLKKTGGSLPESF